VPLFALLLPAAVLVLAIVDLPASDDVPAVPTMSAVRLPSTSHAGYGAKGSGDKVRWQLYTMVVYLGAAYKDLNVDATALDTLHSLGTSAKSDTRIRPADKQQNKTKRTKEERFASSLWCGGEAAGG